jgi:coenzyme Q-binding protein COQ10
MPAIHGKRRVNYSAQEMFDLVIDVERYPEFVPHCQKHIIISRQRSDKIETLITEMTVGRGPFRETMRNCDTVDLKQRRIIVNSTAASLQYLKAVWGFEPRDDGGCEISFDVCYRFSSALMQLLAGSIFEATFGVFVQAFVRRADRIYGPRKDRRAPNRKTTAKASVGL